MVEEGFDVAVRVGELQDSSLIGRRLAANRRVLAAAPTYLPGHAAPQDPQDLAGHNCLIYTYRSEEHTSELQSLMRISYAVFCLEQNTCSNPCTTHGTHLDPRLN